ncbi:tetratricopeptide repeat protein [Maricaulis sp.]|uniref:tetratricopeptide repeat protein n=1 Tax=Maricaulis sp. TaxID=1486257 RepID=UPI0025B8A5E7|nr:tetratricopeptide repeat protein [Maricaulis sp.]
MYKTLVPTLIAALALTAPSAAGITDLRARLDGDAGQIWIALDDQPTGLASEVSAAGLTLVLDGVSLRARSISPASDTLVAAVTIDPTDGGGVVRLLASRAWTGARAELRQGGVLVTMTVGPAAQVHIADGAMMPSAAPAADPSAFGSVASDADATRHGEAAGATSVEVTESDRAAMLTPAPAPASASAPARASASAPLFAANGSAAPTARDGSSVVPPGVCAEAAQAVADSPWDDDLLHAQAACLSGDGYREAAASIYERMLAFEPENFRATIALAEIRVEQGETQAARDLYNQAARHAISDAEAARARSRLRALQDQ